MKKLWFAIVMMVVGISTVSAQQYYDDRHFYDDEFDWHWDVRVRISDGERSGRLTNWEANRLYRRLEKIEDREYRYMSDGNYTAWEQDRIWDDVVWLNREVGIQLADYDRRFYGFGNIYFGFNSYPWWYNRYYYNGWDFYRFDRLGWGSCNYGYAPFFYVPRNNIYVNNHIYNNQSVRNSYERTYNDNYRNREKNNVVRRDRTEPANRITSSRNGNTGSSSRRSYDTPSSTSRSNESSRRGSVGESPRNYGSSTERNRTYTPSTSSSRGRESYERPSTGSSRDYSAPSSRSSEGARSSAPSRSSSPDYGSSRSREYSAPSRSSEGARSSAPSSSSAPSRSSSSSSDSGSSRSSSRGGRN